MGKTNQAWKKLDEQFHIREKLKAGATIPISARQIKQHTGREPRLMMKFDFREQRPSVIKDATIFPVTNGEYLIVPGDGYHSVEILPTRVHSWEPTEQSLKLESLPWEDGPVSESQLIDMAHASGVLGEFLSEKKLYLTIRGRRRAPEFSFQFGSMGSERQVHVDGVQVEVDAGYEGEALHLLEAKMGVRNDFHVRQLYYPLRMWQQILPHKKIQTVFLSYSDKVLSLRLYEFSNLERIHSIRLVKALDVTFDQEIAVPSLNQVLRETRLQSPPPGVTFPQADDLAKVLDLVDAVAAGITEVEDLVDRYEFSERQAAYYTSAAKYIGFLVPNTHDRKLTTLGMKLSRSSLLKRRTIVVEALARLPVFREMLEHIDKAGNTEMDRELIATNISLVTAKYNLPLNKVTANRRASTVIGWGRWIVEKLALNQI